MSHLTENTSIRACDTLDIVCRSVDIGFFGLIQLSIWIYVLGSHLTVCKELSKPFIVCYEASLTVGSRVAVYTAKCGLLQPWRLVAYNLCVNHLGNMTSDGVIGKCRRILFLSADLAVWNKSQLDQRLESVTDTKCKTISLI